MCRLSALFMLFLTFPLMCLAAPPDVDQDQVIESIIYTDIEHECASFGEMEVALLRDDIALNTNVVTKEPTRSNGAYHLEDPGLRFSQL